MTWGVTTAAVDPSVTFAEIDGTAADKETGEGAELILRIPIKYRFRMVSGYDYYVKI